MRKARLYAGLFVYIYSANQNVKMFMNFSIPSAIGASFITQVDNNPPLVIVSVSEANSALAGYKSLAENYEPAALKMNLKSSGNSIEITLVDSLNSIEVIQLNLPFDPTELSDFIETVPIESRFGFVLGFNGSVLLRQGFKVLTIGGYTYAL